MSLLITRLRVCMFVEEDTLISSHGLAELACLFVISVGLLSSAETHTLTHTHTHTHTWTYRHLYTNRTTFNTHKHTHTHWHRAWQIHTSYTFYTDTSTLDNIVLTAVCVRSLFCKETWVEVVSWASESISQWMLKLFSSYQCPGL